MKKKNYVLFENPHEGEEVPSRGAIIPDHFDELGQLSLVNEGIVQENDMFFTPIHGKLGAIEEYTEGLD
jgi:hypothetical protein